MKTSQNTDYTKIFFFFQFLQLSTVLKGDEKEGLA